MFSTGKDSLATFDLCFKYFKKVYPVHLYSVKGLSFKERYLHYFEKRYKTNITQLPLPDLSIYFQNNVFSNVQRDVSKIGFNDIELYIRKTLNVSYIAYGYRKNESLQRRGQLTKCEGIERKFKRFFPVADWNEKDVLNYLKVNKIPLPEHYAHGFRDINFFEGDALLWLYRNHPDDYGKVKEVYPMIEAELIRALGNEQRRQGQ